MIRPFRFWVQKALPLVYDDSLSYYELLCKVIDYINKMGEGVNEYIEDVNKAIEITNRFDAAMTEWDREVLAALEEMKTYIDNYLDNIDVQEEVNTKLDQMAESGILSNYMSPLIQNDVSEWLTQHITPTSPAVDNTLTVSGAAADAKVTGDKITEIKEDLNETNKVAFDSVSSFLEFEDLAGTEININSIYSIPLTIDTTPGNIIKRIGKNLLYNPYDSGNITLNGITSVVNEDGSVHLSGTATNTYYFIFVGESQRRPISAGTYTISGGVDSIRLIIGITDIGQYTDVGNGATFTITRDTTFYMKIKIESGTSVDVNVYPQIEKGSTKTTWEPYTSKNYTGSSLYNDILKDGVYNFFASESFSLSYGKKLKVNNKAIINVKDYCAGDGISDDTVNLQSALDDAEKKFLFVGDGVYLISSTLNVHSGTTIIGCGKESKIKLANTFSLTGYAWRNSGKYVVRKPMIIFDEDSDSITIKNLFIEGQTAAFKDENEDCITVRGKNHSIENVIIKNINYFPNSFTSRSYPTPGYGIFAFNSENVSIKNCDVSNCGYEDIGTENSNSVIIDGNLCGSANQTGVQVHLNSTNVRIVNNEINALSTERPNHASLTFDADPLTPMNNIIATNNTITGNIGMVAGGEHNVQILNNIIYGTVAQSISATDKWIEKFMFCNNTITGRLILWSDKAIVTGNIIDNQSSSTMIIMHGNDCLIANNNAVGVNNNINEISH